MQSIGIGTLNILEACRLVERPVRQYHAGFRECFGGTHGEPATGQTPFSPRSPYAMAKASAFRLVDNCREACNLYICIRVLFIDESPLRPARCLTQKIIASAVAITNGQAHRLQLGRLDTARDRCRAAEYAEARWRMLQKPKPQDFVIATGQTNTLQEFVAQAFAQHHLHRRQVVEQSSEFVRPADILIISANAGKAGRVLGWWS
jgi:GDPmannose 4,6-dehydratase